jgi:hypothetical protein
MNWQFLSIIRGASSELGKTPRSYVTSLIHLLVTKRLASKPGGTRLPLSQPHADSSRFPIMTVYSEYPCDPLVYTADDISAHWLLSNYKNSKKQAMNAEWQRVCSGRYSEASA